MAEVKLTYFPVKALAEPIRYLLSFGEVKFIDDRFDSNDWPKLKPTMPFGQTPVLEIEGKRIHQSVAISRYLGKKYGVAGSNDWENLEIDIIVDTVGDLRAKIASYHYETNVQAKEEKKGPLFKDVIPYFLEKLNEVAQENKGHLALKKLTWADFFFAGVADYLSAMAGFDITAKHPALKSVKDHVENIPTVKAWIEKRPKSEF